MKNPELAIRKLEVMEGKLTTMSVMLTRPSSTEEYQAIILQCEELVDDLKTMIERN